MRLTRRGRMLASATLATVTAAIWLALVCWMVTA